MGINYNNGKIYKIVPKSGEDEAYIGSTTKERLCQRMQQHRSSYFRYKKDVCKKVTSYDLFDKYGIDNCEIVLIELVNCNSKDQLHIRERFWIESTNCVNKLVVGRNRKEYKEANNDKIKEYQREYYQLNQEKRKLQDGEYRELNREKINQYKRKYKEANNDKLKEYQREYYQLHKKGGMMIWKKTFLKCLGKMKMI